MNKCVNKYASELVNGDLANLRKLDSAHYTVVVSTGPVNVGPNSDPYVLIMDTNNDYFLLRADRLTRVIE